MGTVDDTTGTDSQDKRDKWRERLKQRMSVVGVNSVNTKAKAVESSESQDEQRLRDNNEAKLDQNPAVKRLSLKLQERLNNAKASAGDSTISTTSTAESSENVAVTALRKSIAEGMQPERRLSLSLKERIDKAKALKESIGDTGHGKSAASRRFSQRVSQLTGNRRPSAEKAQSRNSIFNAVTLGEEDIPQVIGSYQIELDTGMENVDCFFLDPPEQQLLGKRFQSKGLLICLHGMPPSTEILEEWITLAQRTGLLGLGITMAVPNVQMSSVMEAEDFRRIIGAILGQVGLKQCLLMGKGWGGPEVIKFTLEYSALVSGLILFAPMTPVPMEANEIACPVCLLWAKDDDLMPVEDASEYLSALRARKTPTMSHISDKGGHQVDRIVDDEKALKTFSAFISFVLHLADPQDEPDPEAQHSASSSSDEDDDQPPELSLKAKARELAANDNRQRPPQVAETAVNRRTSIFSAVSFQDLDVKPLAGRNVELDTGEEIVDCHFFEPMEKQLGSDLPLGNPSDGVIVCIHGMPPSTEILEEWNTIAQRTGLLGMGITFALPNVQMSSVLLPEDFERIIDAILVHCLATRCLIFGKGWGGQFVSSFAAEKPEKINGVILSSPTGPPPMSICELSLPLLILLAKRDDVVPFEEQREYVDELKGAQVEVKIHISENGGHQCDRIVDDREASDLFKKFVESSLKSLSTFSPAQKVLKAPKAAETMPFKPPERRGIGDAGSDTVGSVVQLDTGSEIIDCRFLYPKRGVQSIAVLICLHGMVPSDEVLKEWSDVAEHAGLLSLGVTVAIPNVQMTSVLEADDFLRIVDAILNKVNTNECLLLGKGWGGPRAVDFALEYPEKLCGLILSSPSAPAPQLTEDLEVPALLLWAKDDDVVPFEESQDYLEALDVCECPNFVHVSESGGHSFDRIIVDRKALQSVQKFVNHCLQDVDASHQLVTADDTDGYIPEEKTSDVNASNRRSSMFSAVSFDTTGSSRFGGYVAELDTGLEIVDCQFFEPLERKMGGDFQMRGLIICLHGMPPGDEVVEEWSNFAQRAGLLGLGITIAIPNVQMCSVLSSEDFLRIIEAVMEKQQMRQCLLLGKAWGGPHVVNFALENPELLVGVVLSSPSAPPPEQISELTVPVLLLWAEDDEVVSYEDEAKEYIKELENHPQATIAISQNGGHNCDRLTADKKALNVFRSFLTTVFQLPWTSWSISLGN